MPAHPDELEDLKHGDMTDCMPDYMPYPASGIHITGNGLPPALNGGKHHTLPSSCKYPSASSAVINSASLDKATFNKLRGEPEVKERVRFADADGVTVYPGTDNNDNLTLTHLSNGKLPANGTGGSSRDLPPRYATLPHKSSVNNSIIPQSLSASQVSDHIYSTTSRPGAPKPAPLPRAPGTNLSQSSPPTSITPPLANGPILKKRGAGDGGGGGPSPIPHGTI
jgi:hypothetical protein